jgi:AP-1 complex subunit beta-1
VPRPCKKQPSSKSSPLFGYSTNIRREQKQDAIENPIAAAAVAAAVAGGSTAQSNIENLLDIDFDGAAPASLEGQSGVSGLEDLMGGPSPPPAGASGAGNMDDLMGIFGGSGPVASPSDDVMNGFGGLDLGGASQSPPALGQGDRKKTNDLIMDLF